MGFSRAQQIKFRVLVGRAWRAHCDRECITESTHASKDAWYRGELSAAVGEDSSTKCNKKDDYEGAMAHFEALCDDGSFYWQMKAINGRADRALHVVHETARELGLPAEYIQAIAEQKGIHKPLRDCSAQELIEIRIALERHGKRQRERAVDASG